MNILATFSSSRFESDTAVNIANVTAGAMRDGAKAIDDKISIRAAREDTRHVPNVMAHATVPLNRFPAPTSSARTF